MYIPVFPTFSTLLVFDSVRYIKLICQLLRARYNSISYRIVLYSIQNDNGY